MRKAFLIIGILCVGAAFAIIARKNIDSFSGRGRRKAYKDSHGKISYAAFSPDAEKLVFLMDDESGEYHRTHTYLYSIRQKEIKKLDTNMARYLSGWFHWAPDSIHIGFNESDPNIAYHYTGCVFNTETNAVVEKFELYFNGWIAGGKKQLFYNLLTGDQYIRETGKPVWSILPKKLGMGKDWCCLTFDGKYLVYSDTAKELYRYNLKDETTTLLASLEQFPISGFLFPSKSTNTVFYMGRKEAEANYLPRELFKVDVNTGRVSKVLGPDPEASEETYIALMQTFPAFNDNPIYYAERSRESPRGKLIKFDTQSGEKECIFEGDFHAQDYSIKKDILAITTDKGRTLNLFDPKTRAFEEIFSSTQG